MIREILLEGKPIYPQARVSIALIALKTSAKDYFSNPLL
jgi:hypothetical protein